MSWPQSQSPRRRLGRRGKRRGQALLTLLVFHWCEETGSARLVERGQRCERGFLRFVLTLADHARVERAIERHEVLLFPSPLAGDTREKQQFEFRMFVSRFRVYRNTDSILQICLL
jgi:hypothetical protein